jgi:hypothetical protein
MSGLYRQLCADPEFPRPAKHPYGAGQVLESEPVRFEHCDLVGFASSRRSPSDDRTEFLQPVPVETVYQQVSAFEARHFGRINHHSVGAAQCLGVKLALLGKVRAYRVDMCTGSELCTVENRLRRTGGGDEHVGVAYGSLGLGCFKGEASASTHLCNKPVSAVGRATNYKHSSQIGQDSCHGLDLALGLPAGTEDGEHLAVGASQALRSDRAGGAGAPLAERAGFDNRVQLSTGQPVEQEGEAGALGNVRAYYRIALDAHRAERRRECPHDVEHRALDTPSTTRTVYSLATAEQAESILDGLNGHGYGQKLSNLSLAQQQGHHKEPSI